MSVTIKYDQQNRATIYVRDALSVASIGELRRAMEKVKKEGRFASVNLSDLTLADRSSLQYLASLIHEGTELCECPSYITAWINKVSPR